MSRERQELEVERIAKEFTADWDRKFLGMMFKQYATPPYSGLDDAIKSIPADQWAMFFEEFMGNYAPEGKA